ncbi:glucan endo-1,3-beta-glucosidase, acidic-like [Salvia hispanica]|uniref:glucan endo-1,3-beta-glucosidase, acidic-like n=1 Tax=Salvia hispanica TaxID=49212 RepID=UPI002009A0DD|nr:glucan endo-1,3-beta-glucosidase, acidic-like [Salvia hispanica]
MASTDNHLKLTVLLLGLLFVTSLHLTAGQVGTFFGRLGTNLPGPAATVTLYQQNNIRRMRLFDPHAPTLRALSGTNIRLMMGVSHSDLRDLANCPQAATVWVRQNILRFPNVTFRYIIVGNEIDPNSELGPFVFPAMQNVYRAIRAAGQGGRVQVSTSIQISLLSQWSPPQAAAFKCSVNWFIRPILEFMRDTRAPMHINVFPFYAYLNDRRNINLSFALLQPNSGVVLGGVYYDNLFYVIHDAFIASMTKILAAASPLSLQQTPEMKSGMKVSGTTGISSGGKHAAPPPKPSIPFERNTTALSDGPINTVNNARTYINNLMRVVRTGTPMRPGQPIETFIFAMFDENLRPGPEYERHFGIFLPNSQPKFPFRFR